MPSLAEPLLPQNVEAEAGVLGSLLIDPTAIAQVADFLRPDDFYREAHRSIYAAALAMFETGMPADLITLTDELARRGQLEEVGGSSYVSALANQVPTYRNITQYAQIVFRTALLRRLIHASGQIAALAYNDPDAESALDEAERLIFAVSQQAIHQGFKPISEALREYLDELNQVAMQPGTVIGTPTGFHELDRMTAGLQKSDLIILAARPAVGKCLPWYTLLDDPASGERLTLEQFVRERRATVYGMGADGALRPTRIAEWIDSGVQPVYRVVTGTGRSVEVTGHHPFLAPSGWTPLSHLAVGDTIAVPATLPVFGRDDSWPLAKIRLLAACLAARLWDHPRNAHRTARTRSGARTAPRRSWMARTGRMPGARALQHARRSDTAAQVQHLLHARPDVAACHAHATQEGVWLREFQTLGIWGVERMNLRFPTCVWTWPRAQLAAFVAAVMVQADARPVRAQCLMAPITLTVGAHGFAADVQHALLRLGIVATLRARRGHRWSVAITAPADVATYHKQIGWLQKAIDPAWEPRTPATHGRAAPAQHAGTRVLRRSRPRRSPHRGHSLFARVPARTSGSVRATPTDRRLDSTNSSLDQAAAEARTLPDLLWDRIIAIESMGEQQVYDLSVPDGHNFVAQDVLVHNTSLALSLAHNAALRYGQGVAIFSLEMSTVQLVARLLAMDASVDQHKLRTGWITDDEWERINASIVRLAESQIFIDDTPGMTLLEMRSKARRLMMERGFDLLIVDYLQLMQGTRGGGNGRLENRVQEISEISRGLKGLARELHVPVLALSQLSRAVESRADKKPQLSDLRESGCLAGDTPVYLPDRNLYRPIGQLVGEAGFPVLALNPATRRLERATTCRAFSTGIKTVYRLTTRRGRTIRATANHKFLTADGWQRLDALFAGMQLALADPAPAGAPDRASDGASDGVLWDADAVYWDDIVALEPDGAEEVFDLTVEGLHNFVASGFVVHNSIEQDADIVMFIYRDEVYNPDTDRKNIADIIVAKHRNGPVGQVSLYFQAAQTRYRDLDLHYASATATGQMDTSHESAWDSGDDRE